MIETAERRQAVRALLRRPLVAAPSDDLRLIRRHAEPLQRWFTDVLGYRLVVEQGFARLHKVRGVPLDARRPALTRTKQPFDRRRYALVCLVLAALERAESQILLTELAEHVALLAVSAESVEPLELDRQADRRAFVDAVRLVADLGAIRVVDGDDQRFVDGSGDALYDVDHRIAAQVLSSPVPASLAQTVERMTVEPYPETDEGRRRRTRHRVMRRLVEEPVLYLEDLDDGERIWLQSQRSWVVSRLAEAGLGLEVRREGALAVDPDDELSDVRFPGPGTLPHAALLLGEALVAHRDRDVGWTWIRSTVGTLVRANESRWSKNRTQDPHALARDAVGLLASLDLVRELPEGVRVMPALARYRPQEGP